MPPEGRNLGHHQACILDLYIACGEVVMPEQGEPFEGRAGGVGHTLNPEALNAAEWPIQAKPGFDPVEKLREFGRRHSIGGGL
jgi:hypothetical protein